MTTRTARPTPKQACARCGSEAMPLERDPATREIRCMFRWNCDVRQAAQAVKPAAGEGR
jgi:hypothetical protein